VSDYQPTLAERLRLAAAFAAAAEAGFGVYDGTTFEAYPGLEAAAADHIEALLLRQEP
jgi:hypothetical protein